MPVAREFHKLSMFPLLLKVTVPRNLIVFYLAIPVRPLIVCSLLVGMDRPSTPPPQSADHRASFDSPRSVNSNSQEAYTSLSDLMKQKKKPRTSSNPKPQPLRLGQESSDSPDRNRGARVAGQRGQNYGAVSDAAAAAKKKEKNRHKKLSFKQLVALTVSMGGSQVRQGALSHL